MSSMRCTFVKTIKEEKGDNVVQTKYLCKWDNRSLNQHDIIPEVYQLHTTKDRTRRTPTTTYKNTPFEAMNLKRIYFIETRLTEWKSN